MFERLHPPPPLRARLAEKLPDEPLPLWASMLLGVLAELPLAGAAVKALKEAASEWSEEQDQQALTAQLAELLRVGAQTGERVSVVEALAREIYEHHAEILELLRSRGADPTAEGLAAFARTAALAAYRNRVANEHLYADHRGVEGVARQAHAASIRLEEVYVPPRLLPARPHDDGREQALLQELLRAAELPAAARERTEREYAELTGRRWSPGGSEEGALSAGEALAGARQAVVIGGPGVGKSTLARFLARAAALGPDAMAAPLGWEEETLPVLLPLALFADARREQPRLRLRDYLDARMREQGGEALREAVAAELQAGRAWVLLDGVDEVSDPRGRALLVQAVDAFITDHPAARVLVTSRPYGYVRLRGELPHFTLPNFTREQVDEFVRRWHRAQEARRHPRAPDLAAADAEADALLAEIRRNHRVEELAANPLMLVIVALIRYESTRLPDKRVQLYERAVNTLMDTWNVWRSRLGQEVQGTVLPRERMVEVWGAVAAWTRAAGDTGVVHRGELRRKVAAVLREREYADRDAEPTADAYLQAAAGQAGILEERGRDIFAFWHPTFEEFLAAVELATPSSRAVPRLLERADDPRWREVVLLAVGCIGVVHHDPATATEIVRALLDRDVPVTEPLLHGRLLLAAACVADGVGVRRSVAEEVLMRLAKVVREHSYYLFSGVLYGALQGASVPEPSAELVDALVRAAEAAGSLRSAVIAFLAPWVRHSDSARAASMALLEQMDGIARSEAALSLVRAGDERVEVWHALIDGSPFVRPVPTEAQPILASAPDAFWRVMEEAMREGTPAERLRAALVFCEAGRPGATVLATLIELGRSGQGEWAWAVRRLRAEQGFEELVRDILRQRLKAGTDYDRLETAAQLVAIFPPEEEAVAYLKKMALTRYADRSVAVHLLTEAGRLDDDLLRDLRAVLRDPDPARRMDAATSLGMLAESDVELVPELRAELAAAYRGLLHEGTANSRNVAAWLLQQVSDSDADRDAVAAMHREMAFAGDSLAVRRLADMGRADEELWRRVRAWLTDDSAETRLSGAYAADALGAFDEQAVRVAESLLDEEEEKIARAACELLFRAGRAGPAARKALLRLMPEERNRNLMDASGIFDTIPDAEALPVLKRALRSGDAKRASWALDALLKRHRVDEEVLDVWLGWIGGDDGQGAAACRRVLRREPLSSADVAALVELTKLRLDAEDGLLPETAEWAFVATAVAGDAGDRRLARYRLFDWLSSTLGAYAAVP
jgi:hypothetical protein